MIFLALSCLQGRTMESAANELLELEPDGLQLTPGCAPTKDFEKNLSMMGVKTRTHHGYCETALRQRVWDGARLLVSSDSVHPPLSKKGVEHYQEGIDWWANACQWSCALEVMYGDYILGYGSEVRIAMQMRLPLAVDISHVQIQLRNGTMSHDTWRLLQNYDHISEVHVSESRDEKDAHLPITAKTPWLEWAQERMKSGTVVVLESYMHKLTKVQRKQQLAILRGEHA